MILIDANIFMYAAGAEHRSKAPSVAFLRQVAAGETDAAIDAEVLQEILHRYRALDRWVEGRRVYDLARRIVPVVIPITADLLDRARHLLDGHAGLTARDALHAAAVFDSNADGLVSYDDDFDVIPGLQRIEP
jgi:hypothetical protein